MNRSISLVSTFCTAFCLLAASNFAQASQQVPVHDTYITVNDVLIPSEPKPNGEAYVVISGMFPNSCYSYKGSQVADRSATEHDVRVVATVRETMCLMVLVPFTKEVMLGRLSSGQHTLRFIAGDKTYFEKTIVIP